MKWLYPQADVPVFQLSIDISKDLSWHLEIGKAIADLRNRGVLILGSGNVVHNLKAMRAADKPYDWATEFDSFFAEKLSDRNFSILANVKNNEELMRMAHPSLDHYIPALTIAGAANDHDVLHFMNEEIDLSSISMRSFVFHSS